MKHQVSAYLAGGGEGGSRGLGAGSLPGRAAAGGRVPVFLVFAACVVLPGCSREWYRSWADGEAARILAEKRGLVAESHESGRSYPREAEAMELEDVAPWGETEDLVRVPPPEPPRAPQVLPEDGAPAERESPGDASQSGADAEGTGTPRTGSPDESDGEGARPAEGTGAGGSPAPPEATVPREGGKPAGQAETSGATGSSGTGSAGVPQVGGEEAAAAGSPRTGQAEGEGAPDAESRAPDATEAHAGLGGSGREEFIPGAPRVPARILGLREAVELALRNNRDYQSGREDVYLSALALALARWDFAPRFFGIVTGNWEHAAGGEESGSLSSTLGFNWLLASGAQLSISILNNLSQFFTGNRREVAESILRGTITQPLLRGFGSHIVQEPLIQAERDVVYQIREFERFRKTFAVRVVSEYYRVLQERDRVRNEYNNWRSLVLNRDRVEALAEAGQRALLEVDQARQQELQAQDRYFAAVERYESVLDGFKITLGIPVTEPLALDPAELDRLLEQGVRELDIDVEGAIAAAMEMRLDLATARDRLADAERRIEVLADALRAQLDVSAEVSLESGEGTDQKPLRFDTGDLAYDLGFTLNLPLDRKAERNAYVSALIARQRALRSLTLLEDQIRLAVRDAYRSLKREIVTYRIQRASVELAEQRVTSTSFLLQAGRAETRDVLESQAALIQARNALTESLVNYTVARLEFYRDVGALRVGDDGTLREIPFGEEPR